MNSLRNLFQPKPPEPDAPQPFGYKQTWLTLAAAEPRAVAQALGLTDIRPCGWAQGTQPSVTHQIFIAPPVRGWTFVVGEPHDPNDAAPIAAQVTQLLTRLSAAIGVAHYFATYRHVGFHCWARAEHGSLVRGYAFMDELLWDEGAATTEAALGLRFAEHTFPDEEDVMRIARAWCIAPSDLVATDAAPALGLCGNL